MTSSVRSAAPPARRRRQPSGDPTASLSPAALLLVTAALLAAGCVLFTPTVTFDRGFVEEELGCPYPDVLERSRSRRAGLSTPGRYFTPRMGWDACVLLSHNGRPDRVVRTEIGDRPALRMRYEGAPGEGEVLLQRPACPGDCDRRRRPWEVVFVRW